ncbi:hypothetical protein BCR35DRAFT_76465 [Leucosporidium creatinivorum]|uniref:Uncharacterized protein n=1 Tax=Leucosporidium creatinivorum TaxID=106004 RepID=A0A1Y2G313_9BASI|nr:hypothetical protein BCR35DRAFT_76465 [Leucosporidium creatinivorum]
MCSKLISALKRPTDVAKSSSLCNGRPRPKKAPTELMFERRKSEREKISLHPVLAFLRREKGRTHPLPPLLSSTFCSIASFSLLNRSSSLSLILSNSGSACPLQTIIRWVVRIL